MNNFAVARIFERIADLMELKGENVFKIRAYRQASQTMQELTESLEVLAERGELRVIPGVGEAIAAKTRDILATGTTRLLDELRSEVPESLVELLALPGFGVKKVHAVWRGLEVCSLDDLERVAREARLRTLPGFTARTEATLLESIQAHRMRRTAAPIGLARPEVLAVAQDLRRSGTAAAEPAGDLRRWRDTVRERVLVVLPGSGGATPAHAETARGNRVRICLSRPERYGLDLLLQTGSEAHLERLRDRAVARGLSLDDDSLAAPDEKTVYD
ncbi:MAG: hypothetical protein FJX77_08920, partial [Armatimonadetes bacterium]|nr:hypothetical protein [Armatimonadota bacterium]